ncbi:hypothetical protein C8T65DRAFT_230900 [Cerioporus squamosus]|nr:hypothetical protein C8T65DRAFT_230900 [Cerioporus squamosus]
METIVDCVRMPDIPLQHPHRRITASGAYCVHNNRVVGLQWAITAFAFAFLGVQAAPLKRDDSSSASVGNLNATYLPQLTSIGFPISPTQTPDLSSALSFVQANTQAVGSVLGTATVRELKAAIVLAQATFAIGPAQSQFSAHIEDGPERDTRRRSSQHWRRCDYPCDGDGCRRRQNEHGRCRLHSSSCDR